VGLGLLFEVPLPYSDPLQLVGLLWITDQPVAETSTSQHTTLTKDRHLYSWRNSNSETQQASDNRPTTLPRGHWDRCSLLYIRIDYGFTCRYFVSWQIVFTSNDHCTARSWCVMRVEQSINMCSQNCLNLLKTKRNLLYVWNQSVPRSKHFLTRL